MTGTPDWPTPTPPPTPAGPAGLDIGGAPEDYQLLALAASYHVDAVVSLGGPSVAEEATTASLRLGYLLLDVPQGAAPTWAQLRTLAGFMRTHDKGGEAVYVHDDIGGGRAVATACMLLLLRGYSWASVQHDMTGPGLSVLGPRQTRALDELMSALDSRGKSLGGNPYSAARIDRW